MIGQSPPFSITNLLSLLQAGGGFQDRFLSFTDTKSVHCLYNVSRTSRSALDASAYSKSPDRFLAWKGLIRGNQDQPDLPDSYTAFRRLFSGSRNYTITIQPNKKLTLTLLKTFLNQGGACERFINHLRYYSGYHNYLLHRALHTEIPKIDQEIQQIVEECRILQTAPFVRPDVIKQKLERISFLERRSFDITGIVWMLNSELRARTRRCIETLVKVLQIIVSFSQTFFARRKRIYPIAPLNATAVEQSRTTVKEGKKIQEDGVGYPIGSTTVIDSNNPEASKTLIVYAKSTERDSLYGLRNFTQICFADDSKCWGTFFVDRQGISKNGEIIFENKLSNTPTIKSTRSIEWSFKLEALRKDFTQSGLHFWQKITQLMTEIFSREKEVKLVTYNARASLWATAGYGWQDMDEERFFFSKDAISKEKLLPGFDTITSERLLPYKVDALYRDFSLHKRQGNSDFETRFLRSPSGSPAEVLFSLDGTSLTWEQYIEQEGPILKGPGPVLPHIMYLDVPEEKEV